MKRRILALGVGAMLLTLTSCGTSYVYTDQFTFEKTKSGLKLIGYNESDPIDVVIPEEAQGKKVTKLNSFLYSSQDLKGVLSLESIKLPDSITNIGDFCFYGCKNLKEVNFPKSLNKVSYQSFAETAITSATLPEGLIRIEEFAFLKCKSLEYVVLPSTIEKIDRGAFRFATELDYIFYNGTIDEYNSVSVLTNSGYDIDYKTILYCYSEASPESLGQYWHYVDGVPTVW